MRRAASPLVFTVAVAAAVACASREEPPKPSHSEPVSATSAPSASSAPSAAGAAEPSGQPAGAEMPAVSPFAFTRGQAEAVLFPDRVPPPASSCAEERWLECLLRARFSGTRDDAALLAANTLLRDDALIGLLPEQDMDGGWRGKIHLVPELPIGAATKHVDWIHRSVHEFSRDILNALTLRAAPSHPVRYRVDFIAFRFFRSVNRTTPSAFAAIETLGGKETWTVSYNVKGSLLGSEDGARETLFHEIFHLNDQAHGEWSSSALGSVFDEIVKRCGARTSCLAPFAPTDTLVKNGTYYAFQPGNGVVEYAAELALRYYQETRAALRHEAFKKKPFKCGPDEDARAWRALVDEFFGGVDLAPAC